MKIEIAFVLLYSAYGLAVGWVLVSDYLKGSYSRKRTPK
jgi:hypothetical protein